MSPRVARAVKLDDIGTTFGGGPMACAAIAGRDRRHRVRATCSRTCAASPPTSARIASSARCTRLPGRGLPHGPVADRPGEGCAGARCSNAISSPARAAIRTCCGCCRPTSSKKSTSTCCATRCSPVAHEALPRPRRFPPRADRRPARRSRERLQDHPEPRALAGKILGLVFFNPSLRTLASFQAGHGAARRQLVRDHAGPGHAGSSRRASTRS